MPVNHVWLLPEIGRRDKNIGNFCHTIDCSSCEVFKKRSLGKYKCDTLEIKGHCLVKELKSYVWCYGLLAAQARD